MSFKYFGRLAGGTQASESLNSTSDSNTLTPFKPQLPATKFMAYGESATSLAFNRALGALSTNIDHLASVLDSPALRAETLTPTYARAGIPGVTGFSSLSDINIQAAGGSVNLGMGNDTPPTWVYVGKHLSNLPDFLKLRSCRAGAPVNAHQDDGTYFSVTPTGVKLNNNAASSIFSFGDLAAGDQPTNDYDGSGYWGTSDEASLPLMVPPITPVSSDVSPYSGGVMAPGLWSWDPDGPNLSKVGGDGGRSWRDFYVRPGCYLRVSGSTHNNGLYRVAEVRRSLTYSGPDGDVGDKAILVNGLNKVSVDDIDKFSAGCLVSWKERGRAEGAATGSPCYAHVLYIEAGLGDSGHLHLDIIGSSEDFDGKKSGTAVGVRQSMNDLGLVDLEEGADQNWSLPLGAEIYNLASVNPDVNKAVVTGIVPAGYPVVFRTDGAAPGTASPHNPPGFLLNPCLTFSAGAHVPPASYYLDAYTLTTVKEQLLSQGASANVGGAEDPTNYSLTKSDILNIARKNRYMAAGPQPHAKFGADSLNQGPVGSAAILGGNLWEVEFTVTNTTGGGATAPFSDRFSAGDLVSFRIGPGIPAADGMAFVYGSVVAAVDNRVIFRDLHLARVARLDANGDTLNPYTDEALNGFGGGPGGAWEGLIKEDSGQAAKHYIVSTPNAEDDMKYVVDSIKYAPYLKRTSGGVDRNEERVPGVGLDAAYHADFSAIPDARGSADHGRIIYAEPGWKPLTMVLSGGDGAESGFEVSSTIGNAAGRETVLLSHRQTSGEINGVSGAHNIKLGTKFSSSFYNPVDGTRSWQPGALYIEDSLIDPESKAGDRGPVKFSEFLNIPHTGNNTGYHVNHAKLPSELVQYDMLSDDPLGNAVGREGSLLGALEALLLGNCAAQGQARQLSTEYGAWSTDLLWGADGTVAEFDGATPTVSISLGMFVCGGAKVICEPHADLTLNGDADGVGFVYWDPVTNTYNSYAGSNYVYNQTVGVSTAPGWVPLYTYQYFAGAVSRFIDVRKPVFAQDRRTNLYVGEPNPVGILNDGEGFNGFNGGYANRVPHFKKLSSAFEAIRLWSSNEDLSLADQDRAFTIELIGDVYEDYFDTRLILDHGNRTQTNLLPMKVPCDGITVIGHGKRTAIHWPREWHGLDEDQNDVTHVTGCSDGDTHEANRVPLIDLNGRSNLTFSNFHAVGPGPGTYQRPSALGVPDVAENDDASKMAVALPYVAVFVNSGQPGKELFAGMHRALGRTLANEAFTTEARDPTISTVSSVGNWLIEGITCEEVSALIVEAMAQGDYSEKPWWHHKQANGWRWSIATNTMGLDNVTIRNCSGTTYHAGVVIASVDGKENWDDAAFSGQKSWGTYHQNVSVENCSFRCSAADANSIGITVTDRSTHDTGVTHALCGIHLSGVHGGRVSGNTLYGYYTGIEVGRFGRATAKLTGVDPNWVDDLNNTLNTRSYLETESIADLGPDSGGVLIEGNFVRNCREHGIAIPNGNIHYGRITGLPGSAIDALTRVTGIVVRDNDVYGVGGRTFLDNPACIFASGSGTVIHNNRLRTGGDYYRAPGAVGPALKLSIDPQDNECRKRMGIYCPPGTTSRAEHRAQFGAMGDTYLNGLIITGNKITLDNNVSPTFDFSEVGIRVDGYRSVLIESNSMNIPARNIRDRFGFRLESHDARNVRNPTALTMKGCTGVAVANNTFYGNVYLTGRAFGSAQFGISGENLIFSGNKILPTGMFNGRGTRGNVPDGGFNIYQKSENFALFGEPENYEGNPAVDLNSSFHPSLTRSDPLNNRRSQDDLTTGTRVYISSWVNGAISNNFLNNVTDMRLGDIPGLGVNLEDPLAEHSCRKFLVEGLFGDVKNICVGVNTEVIFDKIHVPDAYIWGAVSPVDPTAGWQHSWWSRGKNQSAEFLENWKSRGSFQGPYSIQIHNSVFQDIRVANCPSVVIDNCELSMAQLIGEQRDIVENTTSGQWGVVTPVGYGRNNYAIKNSKLRQALIYGADGSLDVTDNNFYEYLVRHVYTGNNRTYSWWDHLGVKPGFRRAVLAINPPVEDEAVAYELGQTLLQPKEKGRRCTNVNVSGNKFHGFSDIVLNDCVNARVKDNTLDANASLWLNMTSVDGLHQPLGDLGDLEFDAPQVDRQTYIRAHGHIPGGQAVGTADWKPIFQNAVWGPGNDSLQLSKISVTRCPGVTISGNSLPGGMYMVPDGFWEGSYFSLSGQIIVDDSLRAKVTGNYLWRSVPTSLVSKQGSEINSNFYTVGDRGNNEITHVDGRVVDADLEIYQFTDSDGFSEDMYSIPWGGSGPRHLIFQQGGSRPGWYFPGIIYVRNGGHTIISENTCGVVSVVGPYSTGSQVIGNSIQARPGRMAKVHEDGLNRQQQLFSVYVESGIESVMISGNVCRGSIRVGDRRTHVDLPTDADDRYQYLAHGGHTITSNHFLYEMSFGCSLAAVNNFNLSEDETGPNILLYAGGSIVADNMLVNDFGHFNVTSTDTEVDEHHALKNRGRISLWQPYNSNIPLPKQRGWHQNTITGNMCHEIWGAVLVDIEARNVQADNIRDGQIVQLNLPHKWGDYITGNKIYAAIVNGNQVAWWSDDNHDNIDG